MPLIYIEEGKDWLDQYKKAKAKRIIIPTRYIVIVCVLIGGVGVYVVTGDAFQAWLAETFFNFTFEVPQ